MSTSYLCLQAQSNLVTFHTELVADLDAVAVRRSFMQCALTEACACACSPPDHYISPAYGRNSVMQSALQKQLRCVRAWTLRDRMACWVVHGGVSLVASNLQVSGSSVAFILSRN